MSEYTFTEEQNVIFNYLFSLDVNDRVEKKKVGGGKSLSYLSWAWAWAEVKKAFPEANYEIERFDNHLPYIYDPLTGYMVFTKVTIGNMTHEMWLPVMDGANKAMKSEPYEYEVIKWTNGKRDGFTLKKVEAATMFDVNTAIMRCLVKNLAMFGLGLYIYAGEDLPEMPKITKEQVVELRDLFKQVSEFKKSSPKTLEAQCLAYFKYGGQLEDADQSLYAVLKDYTMDRLEKLKVEQKQKETNKAK